MIWSRKFTSAFWDCIIPETYIDRQLPWKEIYSVCFCYIYNEISWIWNTSMSWSSIRCRNQSRIWIIVRSEPIPLYKVVSYHYKRWYDGEIISTRSNNTVRILRLMRENPSITYAKLTSMLGTNTSAVQKLIKRMVEKGYITRHDNGLWRVIATSIV